MQSEATNQLKCQPFAVFKAASARCWPFVARCLILVLVAVGLNGCVQSDVGIRFDSPYQGEIVQHLHWDNSGLAASDRRQQSLQRLLKQARQLNARIEHNSLQAWTIRIPFSNAATLEKSLNQLLQPLSDVATSQSGEGAIDLPPLRSHLSVQQSNLLLLLRSHLVYELDLQSFGITSLQGDVVAAPSGLMDLTFQLQTPWGSRALVKGDQITPATQRDRTITWQLQPGQRNRLEAVFWMPNPLGLGTVGIIALVVLGASWKQGQDLADLKPAA
jgi:hypothetical protein